MGYSLIVDVGFCGFGDVPDEDVAEFQLHLVVPVLKEKHSFVSVTCSQFLPPSLGWFTWGWGWVGRLQKDLLTSKGKCSRIFWAVMASPIFCHILCFRLGYLFSKPSYKWPMGMKYVCRKQGGKVNNLCMPMAEEISASPYSGIQAKNQDACADQKSHKIHSLAHTCLLAIPTILESLMNQQGLFHLFL